MNKCTPFLDVSLWLGYLGSIHAWFRQIQPSFKIRHSVRIVLHLTHLGRSFKVELFLGWLLTPGRVRHKNISVLWWRQHGETGTLVLFWFQPSTSASITVPAHCHWLSDWVEGASTEFGWYWIGLKSIGLESERIRVSISPCSPHASTEFDVSVDRPCGPKLTQKLLTLNDLPK